MSDYKPIDVYVEIAGKEKYHQSLKGKDEPNQHPISAITNLQEELDRIDNQFVEFNNEYVLQFQDIHDDIETFETDLKAYLQQELSNIDLEAYYTKKETDEKLEGVFHYKGNVTDFENLPVNGNCKGDVYNVQKTGANYVWTGCAWDNLSPTLCLKGYATKEYVNGTIEATVKLIQGYISVHYYEKEEIDKKLEDFEEQFKNVDKHFEDVDKKFDEVTKQLENIKLDEDILANAFVYKGAVATKGKLPKKDTKIGDVYTVSSNNNKYFWNGTQWEKLGDNIEDLIYTKEEIDTLLKYKADASSVYTKQEIDDKLQAIQGDFTLQLQELWNNVSDKCDKLEKSVNDSLSNLEQSVNDELVNLEKKITENNSDITNKIDEEIHKLHETITEETVKNVFELEQKLSSTIDETNKNVTELGNSVEELNNSITGFDDSISKLESDVTDLQAQIDEINNSEEEDDRNKYWQTFS